MGVARRQTADYCTIASDHLCYEDPRAARIQPLGPDHDETVDCGIGMYSIGFWANGAGCEDCARNLQRDGEFHTQSGAVDDCWGELRDSADGRAGRDGVDAGEPYADAGRGEFARSVGSEPVV